MNKQQLSEALAVLNGRHYLVSDDLTQAGFEAWLEVTAAARLVERLLPGECENCGGTGIAGVHRHIKPSTGEHLGDQDVPCPFCDNGRVWDEGIAATLEAALIPHVESPSLGAIAVLSALVELLTEKVE